MLGCIGYRGTDAIRLGNGRQVHDAIYKAAPEHSLGFLREFASMPSVYDISKAKAHIPEFNPRIPVEKGMARLYKWLKKEGALKEAPKRPFEDRLVRLGLQFLKKAGRE